MNIICRQRLKTNLLLSSLSLLTWAHSVSAQNQILANPAEVIDFRAAFVNPSVLAFQNAHAAVGGKMFHLGFVDGTSNPFRQGYVSLGLPFGRGSGMALGLQAQYFNTPLFSQSNISVLLARKLGYNYSFGVRFNLFSKSFNQENFDLVDANDPVFSGGTTQWAGTLGVGASFLPLSFLSIAAGVDHLNRANVSLIDDDINQPLSAYLGAVLNVGVLRAAVSASYEDNRWVPRTSIATTMRDKGYAMLGFTDNVIQAEGQLRVSGPLSLNYNYEYTLFDSEGIGQGSHAVTLIHEFDRRQALPKFEIPDDYRVEFRPPDRPSSVESGFYIYSIVDKLDIIEKKLTRVIAPDVTAEQLAQLSWNELGVLDSSRVEPVSVYLEEPVDLGRIPATLEAPLSKDYQAFIVELSEELQENDRLKARVITDSESYLRAAGLRKHLQSAEAGQTPRLAFVKPRYKTVQDSLQAARKIGRQTVLPAESLTSLSARATTFEITPVTKMNAPRRWQLVIRDIRGRPAKTFSGEGLPMAELRWDWRDEQNRLVAPGAYTYQLEWWDKLDLKQETPPKYLSVQKLVRHIKIEVTNKNKKTGADADEINIILKN